MQLTKPAENSYKADWHVENSNSSVCVFVSAEWVFSCVWGGRRPGEKVAGFPLQEGD